MKPDVHNCKEEAIDDLISDHLRELHENENCRGYPSCKWCVDQQNGEDLNAERRK
jgi:hypothetical protein